MLELIMPSHAGPLAIFGELGPWEIAIIVLMVLLLFGGKKLPDLARGLGRGLRIFKREMQGIDTSDDDEGRQERPKADDEAGQKKASQSSQDQAKPPQAG